jgi:LPXTG-motif cell wall-anchored protein
LSGRSIEWRRVPSVCRRIAALLAVACLGAAWVGGSVSRAVAQDAGDQQYQDPFGNSGSGSKSKPKATKKPKNQTQTTPDSNLEPLSPSPQTSGGSTGPTTPSTPAKPAPAQQPSAAAAPGLPNTGADTRLLLLAGAALVITGFGLRLRSAPERF